MMDDWTHLMYHQTRAVELHRRAEIHREISRARRRERAAGAASRRDMVSTVVHAFVRAHRAAKMARHDAWIDGISSLKTGKRVRVA